MSVKQTIASMCCCLVLLLICYGATGQSAATKEQQATTDPAQFKRLGYKLNHGKAQELAAVLNKHFKSDAEFEPAPESAGNLLLINVKPGAHDEVLAMLGKLDRRPEMVAVEVILLDLMTRIGNDGKVETPEFDQKDLSGPAERVLANIKRLGHGGVVTKYGSFQTVTIEGKAVTLLHGGSTPYVSNSIVTTAVTGKPTTTNTILYRDVGTQIVVTPSVAAGNVVTLELKLKSSRAVASEIALGAKNVETGQTIFATQFPNVDVNTRLTLNSGNAILADGVQTTSQTAGSKTLVVVIASVLP